MNGSDRHHRRTEKRSTFQLSAGTVTDALPPSTVPPGPALGHTVKGASSVGRDIFSGKEYDFTSGSCRVALPPRESAFVLF